MATVANLLTDIAAINAAGRTALADKGVTVAQDATTAEIISAIGDIPAGGGRTEYSSIEYDEATNTYTLTEKDDPTITHTLTCTYDAQGRINGMVYDDKAIAVTYNNDGTVTVGGTVVDVSEYPQDGAKYNIAYGNTAPTDTSKLWIKAAEPSNVTVDYNPDNAVETATALTEVLPAAKVNITSGAVGNKIYLFGANGSQIIVFDTQLNVLSQRNGSIDAPQAACGVVGNKIYLFGGIFTSSSAQRSILEYDVNENTTRTMGATLPIGMYGMACGVVGTKCYLFGGRTLSGYTLSEQDKIYVYDTETDTLTTLQSVTLPTTAFNIACGVVGNKIYLFGGRSESNGVVLFNTINVFDTTTNTLNPAPVSLLAASDNMAAASFGTKIYLLGGLQTISGSRQSVAVIYVFDAETESITALTETSLPQPLYGAACQVVGTSAYLFGGGSTQLGNIPIDAINKFIITFPLNEGDVFIREDMLRNQFTLVNNPTKVTVGVASVSIGNAQNEAEKCEAYLHDGTSWQQI